MTTCNIGLTNFQETNKLKERTLHELGVWWGFNNKYDNSKKLGFD